MQKVAKRKCLFCKKEFECEKTSKQKFCNPLHRIKYNNTNKSSETG